MLRSTCQRCRKFDFSAALFTHSPMWMRLFNNHKLRVKTAICFTNWWISNKSFAVSRLVNWECDSLSVLAWFWRKDPKVSKWRSRTWVYSGSESLRGRRMSGLEVEVMDDGGFGVVVVILDSYSSSSGSFNDRWTERHPPTWTWTTSLINQQGSQIPSCHIIRPLTQLCVFRPTHEFPLFFTIALVFFCFFLLTINLISITPAIITTFMVLLHHTVWVCFIALFIGGDTFFVWPDKPRSFRFFFFFVIFFIISATAVDLVIVII